MSNNVRNFGVKNYLNQTTIPQLITNNMSGCFFISETQCICNIKLTSDQTISQCTRSEWMLRRQN